MVRRLLALIKKELQILLRDRQTRTVLIAPVIIQSLIFPFAATLEVTNARIAVFNEDNGQGAVELTQRLAKSSAFPQILVLNNSQQIVDTIENQKALLVVRFSKDFSVNLLQGKQASLQILLDGRHSNSAQIAANYIQQIVAGYQQEISVQQQANLQQQAGQGEASAEQPASGQSELVIRHWYNPNLDYKWFMVPSLIALIVTIGILIVTSLSVAREREQGTLEQLLVSPLSTLQIFIGKAIPAQLVALFQGTIILLIGVFFYRIPFTGSLLLFYCAMILYTFSLIGFGLLISAFSATQQQAFIGVFVFMVPCVMLSGYISPVENMPLWLQHLTWINPIRYFMEISKQIYLKDAGLMTISHALWPLLVIAVGTSSIAYCLFRRNIR